MKLIDSKKDILTSKMYKSIVLNYVLKIVCMLLGLITTKVYIQLLGDTLYGKWVTIASIASWINYADLGIGNGVRNGLADAIAQNNVDRQKRLIATSFKTLFNLSGILFLAITIITEAIIALNILEPSLRIPIYITNFFFCIDLFLGIGKSFAYGMQKSWVPSAIGAITSTIRIASVSLLLHLNAETFSLSLFALLLGVVGSAVNAFALFIITHSFHLGRNVKFFVDNSLKKDIVSLGFKFFILQISCLILYASDNLIINKVISSESVTKYDIINKVFSSCDSIFAVFMVALWSAVTYAYAKKDFRWIKREIKRMIILWGLYSLGIIVISLCFNWFVRFWLGSDAIYFEQSIVILFATYAILTAFGAIFVNVTNGIGRLKIQLFFSIIMAIINIPLSIFFAKNLEMGIFGVKLATLICCVGSIVFVPIDVIRFLINEERRAPEHE